MLQTVAELDALPQEVWEVFTAFSKYETWHPLMSLSGDVQSGQLDYSRRPSLTSPRWITTQVEIIESSAPSRLLWRFGVRAIFAIDESFQLEARGNRTILTHCVETCGAFAFVVAPFARKKLGAGMALFDGLLTKRLARESAPAKSTSRTTGVGRNARRRGKRR